MFTNNSVLRRLISCALQVCLSPPQADKVHSCRWQSYAGRELPQQERRAATQEPAKRGGGRLGPRAGIPKRERPNCHEERYSQTGVGSAPREGPQRPQCVKGRAPKDPGVAAPLAAAGCRGNCCVRGSPGGALDGQHGLGFARAHQVRVLVLTVCNKFLPLFDWRRLLRRSHRRHSCASRPQLMARTRCRVSL